MRPGTTGVHHSFWNSFMVEVHDLLTKMEIFQQRRTAVTNAKAVIGVIDWYAGSGRKSVAALGP
jgi:hypothetical protein